MAAFDAEEASIELDADVPAVLVADGVDKTVGGVAFPGEQGIDDLAAFDQVQVTILGGVLRAEFDDHLAGFHVQPGEGFVNYEPFHEEGRDQLTAGGCGAIGAALADKVDEYAVIEL